jgi:hypothetical protein
MTSFRLAAALATSLLLSSSVQAIEGTPKAKALAESIIFNAEATAPFEADTSEAQEALINAARALASFIQTQPDDVLPMWLTNSKLSAESYELIAQCVAEGAFLPPTTPLMDEKLTHLGYIPDDSILCARPDPNQTASLEENGLPLQTSLAFILLKPADGQFELKPHISYPTTRWVGIAQGKGYYTTPNNASELTLSP